MGNKFKFFRGYVGTLNVIDSQTYATASFYNPHLLTEDERLRHINERIERDEQMRNHGRITHEQYMLNRDRLLLEERIGRQHMIEHVRGEDTSLRLFQSTTVTTVNPTPWTKVKIFGTRIKLVLKETWRVEPIGLIMITILSLLVCFIGIAKLFGL